MYQLLVQPKVGSIFEDVPSFSQQHVLVVADQFDQDFVDRLLEKGTPRYIISDHYIKKTDIKGIEVVTGVPMWLERQVKGIVKDLCWDEEIQTDFAFNFMCNKKQINRFLCIKLVELFQLTDFDYTWSNIDPTFDMSYVLAELNTLGAKSPLDDESRSFILQKIRMPKRWFHYKDQVVENGSFASYGGNTWTWRNGLARMFSHSAVSLITESIKTEKSTMFTEKTIYAVLGLTFPIWVGGVEQAKTWADIGFDTFDDIIDHSYQSYDTLIERCYYAFANNLHLLSNIDKLRDLRLQNKQRLLKNRELLLNNKLGQYIDEQVATLPVDLQQIMPDVLNHFRSADSK